MLSMLDVLLANRVGIHFLVLLLLLLLLLVEVADVVFGRLFWFKMSGALELMVLVVCCRKSTLLEPDFRSEDGRTGLTITDVRRSFRMLVGIASCCESLETLPLVGIVVLVGLQLVTALLLSQLFFRSLEMTLSAALFRPLLEGFFSC